LKPTDETRFESAGAVLEYSMVPWDSEIFGFPVAQITRLALHTGSRPAEAFEAFEAWCNERAVRLVSCRLDHLQLQESMALEDAGFRFIELVYRLRLGSFDAIAPPREAVQVSLASTSDLPAIEVIASTAFTTGRFLLDWRLPPELSNRRYATWVRNSVDAPRHSILKAEVDGQLVGFFVVEDRPDGTIYWHLTAIAPGWQGKGIGSSVWRTILLRHRADGATAVETTISGHNLAVVNLYERLGFSFDSAQMTFHWLREAPTVGGR
jgi:RimJ/RimL family protein N-acetyltransferase